MKLRSYGTGRYERGKPSPSWYQNQANLGTVVLATTSSGVKIAIINEGTCSKETLDETLIEGVTAVVDWLFESKCAKCCARLTHGGGWSATLKVLSDSKRMDPAILNCEQTTKYNCKWNEDGPQPSCGLWYNHDVL
ncbi:hypothetical protein E3Q11_00714 [Wallemia mellicola]|nr:hypothetical protein E3Q11_00714 [Wallemia mellicola]